MACITIIKNAVRIEYAYKLPGSFFQARKLIENRDLYEIYTLYVLYCL